MATSPPRSLSRTDVQERAESIRADLADPVLSEDERLELEQVLNKLESVLAPRKYSLPKPEWPDDLSELEQ